MLNKLEEATARRCSSSAETAGDLDQNAHLRAEPTTIASDATLTRVRYCVIFACRALFPLKSRD